MSRRHSSELTSFPCVCVSKCWIHSAPISPSVQPFDDRQTLGMRISLQSTVLRWYLRCTKWIILNPLCLKILPLKYHNRSKRRAICTDSAHHSNILFVPILHS